MIHNIYDQSSIKYVCRNILTILIRIGLDKVKKLIYVILIID